MPPETEVPPWEEFSAKTEVPPWEEFGTEVEKPAFIPKASDLARRFKEEQAIGEAAESKANRLASAEASLKLIAPSAENPLGPIGGLFRSAQATGKMLGAAVTDIADLPSEIASNQLLRNLRAWWNQKPEPIPGRLGFTGQVAKGIAETAPVVAEQMMLTAAGIPAPVSGGIAFGGAAEASGASPAEIAKQTAFGVVLGPAQQWSKEATGKVLKETIARLPVPIPETALKAAEFAGSQTAVNALFSGMEAPAYVEAYKRNPKEAKDMLVQQVAMNLAFGVHDALGIKNPNVRSETIKAVYADLRKMLDDLEVQKPITEKTPEQTQKDTEQAAKTLTERPTDAIQRETTPILRPVRPQPGKGEGKVPVSGTVETPAIRSEPVEAKAGEQPAYTPREGPLDIESVKGPEGEVFSQKQVDELQKQYPNLKVITLEDSATGETRTVFDTGKNWTMTDKRKVVVPGTVGGQVARNESAIRPTEKIVTEPTAVPAPKPAEAPSATQEFLAKAKARAEQVARSAVPKLSPEVVKAVQALPPPKPGYVRWWHGEKGVASGGETGLYHAEALPGNPLAGVTKALQYGPDLSYIDLPQSLSDTYRAKHRTGESAILDSKLLSARNEVGTFEQPISAVIEAPELEAPKPAEPTPETEPAKPIPQPIIELVEKWRKAEKRYRRARRQEPSDVEDADIERIGAEGMFRDEAAKAGLTQKQFDDLRQYAKQTETEQTPELESLTEPAKAEAVPELQPVGAATPADVKATQSDMAQLADTMENVSSPKKTATQRVAEAKQAVVNLKTELPKNIGEMARNGVERLAAIGSAIKTGLTKLPEFTEFKKIMGQWLGANQQADLELRRFVKNINKTIPKDRQVAITNYIQADGDAAILRQRADASKTSKLRKGYEDALTLTRDEKIAADQIRVYLDNRLQEGIDSGILDHGLENYITQIWKRPNAVTQKLISDISIGKLQPNFRYARQRLLESYFEGEQKGLVPANKAVSALIAAYDQSFNRSLAARAFIKNLTEGKASDGRPLVEVSGSGRLVGDEGSKQAVLVKSKTKPEDIADYRTIDHPALRKWKWASKTPDGTNVFVEGQLLVHPEIYSHLRNILSRSAFRQYAFPRAILKTERLIKELMFTLSGFHQVQETLHGLGHRVNPTNLETLDMSKPWLKEGVEHGLQIADYNALENFSEGLSSGSVISKFPLVGKRLLGPYTEWLFQDNIPRLKVTMYKHAMERNLERFDSQLRSGKISRDQVAELTANQANAAFGELNLKWMGRNPTFQDALRTFLIAPDFLEARGRFVGQALKPYGREQLVALGLLAATQYITARILNQIFDKNPHFEPENAFKLIVGKHSYELRSVPGDILHLISKPHQFATARISPLLRQGIEAITGRDWRGVKRDALEQVKDFARLPTPISLRREDDQRWWETFLNAFGVHERSYTAGQEIGDLARKYRESVKGKPVVEVLEDTDSPYRKLRVSLDVGNKRAAIQALQELRKTHKDKDIYQAMKRGQTTAFTGLSKAEESKFRQSLSPVEQDKYDEALKERQERFKKFQMLISEGI